MKFLNRKDELMFMEEQWENKRAAFIPIYGRRRVGKSRLITEFLKDKPHIYHLAAQESAREQIANLKNTLAAWMDDDFLKNASIDNWRVLFDYLKRNIPRDEHLVIAIDEVTYIIKRDASFISHLQGFWDTFLKDTGIMLILCGSLVGLMKESILSYSSPLYGRRSGQIHLKPLSPWHMAELIEDREKAVRLYSILGGIPRYYELIDHTEAMSNIVDSILRPESVFFEEGIFLLGQEFKELGNYNSILKSISMGNTKLSDIANEIGMDSRKLSNYLDKLYEIGFIRKLKPVTNTQKRYRGYRYYLKDNFMDFWFRFVFPNRSHIEKRSFGHDDIRERLEMFVSEKFEDICQMVLSGRYSSNKVGRWWFKGEEIDLVGLDETRSEIVFCECKWSDDVDGKKLYRNLLNKKDMVRWKNDSRKERFALFARSFNEGNIPDDCECVDLERMW